MPTEEYLITNISKIDEDSFGFNMICMLGNFYRNTENMVWFLQFTLSINDTNNIIPNNVNIPITIDSDDFKDNTEKLNRNFVIQTGHEYDITIPLFKTRSELLASINNRYFNFKLNLPDEWI